MATVRKTITLTEQQDAWIAAVREALSEGEDSGAAEAFDFAAFKQRKAAERG
ncbi:type II toxin-antitoxin system ParD family antitoxin [Sphingomonas sp. CFBP 13603]|uniref:type II toxin-antitoxin system ParD family antitoxin n=1 Tax=Sphingomonas sp. CFBP 13603 TaxID=2774040 RepID=UPI001867710D|nr:type II toxin-antitoxin system ParD family antitoxin [Sphingomonas sp. CFBP 13603]MBE2993139.1 type II toxin-antitoxin system ParD family antitoxin [Sphingomonas sp. CFBP 13603]